MIAPGGAPWESAGSITQHKRNNPIEKRTIALIIFLSFGAVFPDFFTSSPDKGIIQKFFPSESKQSKDQRKQGESVSPPSQVLNISWPKSQKTHQQNL
jgi:hypothetical protein|tara:strand:- start:415 stop:708 length:294 start_codon:yes stop_codon:yes gene_type:complete